MIRIYIYILIFFLGVSSRYSAQNILMEFPYFAGKTYEFIIFQGSGSKKVFEGKIPADGRFVLSVPEEYVPYTGMCRWLITGTQEGGGLDMVISGKDFSVRCLSEKPDNSNIIYTGNTETQKLNDLHKIQERIFSRHDAMLQATKAYSQSDKNYSVFMKEYQSQLKAYDKFHAKLKDENSYASEFLKIVNITQGIGRKIENSEEKRAKDISGYIRDELNWQYLYTSGHWSGVISSWVGIHTEVFKDKKNFASDFAVISHKLSRAGHYADFVKHVSYVLTEQGKDDFIAEISPMVVGSGKIERYEGTLSVYTKGVLGTFAPDLVLSIEKNGSKEKSTLKSNELSGKYYQKTLLVFYNSECGSCEGVLKDLSQRFSEIKSEGIRIISISSDADKLVFEDKAKTFPWEEAYCDFEGLQGENFRNYAIIGTPTLILVDNEGKILARSAGLSEIEPYLKKR